MGLKITLTGIVVFVALLLYLKIRCEVGDDNMSKKEAIVGGCVAMISLISIFVGVLVMVWNL